MIARARHSLAALAVLAAIGTAGCGSSDKPQGKGLPTQAANAIQQRLSEIQRRYDAATQNDNAGACRDIQTDSLPAIDQTITGLPKDVDPDVRQALDESVSRLQSLTEDGCANLKPTETQTETTPAPPPDTTPQETTPQQTDTQTETTPKPPSKQKEKQPKDNGNGGTAPGSGDGGGTGVPVPGGGD